jgi:hypothetical protein
VAYRIIDARAGGKFRGKVAQVAKVTKVAQVAKVAKVAQVKAKARTKATDPLLPKEGRNGAPRPYPLLPKALRSRVRGK